MKCVHTVVGAQYMQLPTLGRFVNRSSKLHGRWQIQAVKNEVDKSGGSDVEDNDVQISRVTPENIGDMEKLYLNALRTYYYEGKQLLSDSEFDRLKENLTWNGSKVVVLSPDELRFLEAIAAHREGSPIMSNQAYDKLKASLPRERLRELAGPYFAQAEAEQEKGYASDDIEDCAYNVSAEYCSIDEMAKRVRERTVGDMEKQYLDALRSYYYEGKSLITDEEFDMLKEELTWNGSKVVVMSSDEQRYLEATAALREGQQIMTEEEYDELTDRLRVLGSTVVMQGPRCNLLTRKVYTDARLDAVRMTALNLPAAVVILSTVYLGDRLTGEPIVQLLETQGLVGIESWFAIIPIVLLLTTQATNLLFRNMKILKGPCPVCGAENVSYFGDIFTVPGPTVKSQVTCTNCQSVLEFNLRKREILFDEEATKKAKEDAEKLKQAAAKRAAAGKKKAAK